MPQADDPDNGDEETFEAQENTAGFAQRPAPPDPFGLSTGQSDLPEELTPEELDARQAAIGTRRRKGPPLPEGEEHLDDPGLGFGLGGNDDQGAAPTEVKEPPDND
jgi:hypothetical protein